MSKYTERFTEQEHYLSTYKVQLKADFEAVKHELTKRVSNFDMQLNMKALEDFMLVKFG